MKKPLNKVERTVTFTHTQFTMFMYTNAILGMIAGAGITFWMMT